ncbi:PREDICTED: EF-hand domain-containing protein D2-like [Acropora digitifera]|uniref:EF-hand domain-containing protein D2-like n=1 Tax=Acropora digitifera TaxID=70779 RepID=UPI00077A21A1|nr:PREDICTED: EF-hand domain-containing protein D2-like [Acropora digitifera]
MSETNELSSKLAHRQALNEDENLPRRQLKVFNPYTEFKEFTRKQIKDFEKMFKKYDVNNDHYLDLMEMKQMMEKLGAPQTHIGLKNMIAEIDEDSDGKVSFREVNSQPCSKGVSSSLPWSRKGKGKKETLGMVGKLLYSNFIPLC